MPEGEPASESTGLQKQLGLRDLILFNVAAIISTRWIAAAAHLGPQSIILWLGAILLFLVPSALVVSTLSKRFPDQGGLYIWTREAFGDWHGFLCGWFYYLNNLFWIPGLLLSSVSMLVISFGQGSAPFAERSSFIVPVTLAILLLVIGVNYVGLGVAKWVDNAGGFGAMLIWVLLVGAAAYVYLHRGTATALHLTTTFDASKLNFWSQLAFALTGLELSPILSGEIKSARRTLLIATWVSAGVVACFYIFGTSAILVLLPPDQVSPVVGLPQAVQSAAQIYPYLAWIPLAVAVCISVSVGGQLGTYIGACARLPYVLGIGKMLPEPLARLHPRFKTPYISIVVMGTGAAMLLIVSQLGETFRGAYQLTVDMTVITLFIPFLYIFAAGWRFGQRIPAACGLGVSLLAIAFSLVPTADVRSVPLFEAKLIGGSVLLLGLARLLYRRHISRGEKSLHPPLETFR